MKRFISTGVLVALMLTGSVAFAQSDNIKEFTFEEDQIAGKILIPDGSITTVPQPQSKRELVRVRDDFNDVTRKTVDDL